MGVAHDHLIIWLDLYIGQDDVCIDLKEKLSNAINIDIDEPLIRHEIDRLILNNDVCPRIRDQLTTVKTIEECLELIDTHYHKKIFLITSGSLGRVLIPRVSSDYPYVDKIFVFCQHIVSHLDWAMDFTDNLLMFDFHNDLFARVTYDIGMYYMEQGIFFSDLNEHLRALYYFFIAKKLIMRANHSFSSYYRFGLTRIEELITKEEEQLPINLVQNMLNNLYHG
jgi:hypothetical protein